MAYDKVIDSTKLEAGMTATANAIRAKTGGSSPIEWNEETGFKTAVEVISSGDGVELPELGDTAAQPTDMAAGKQLIGPDGSIVTGTLAEATEGTKVFANGNYGVEGTPGNTTIVPYGTFDTNNIGDNTRGFIARPGTVFHLRTFPTSLLGNARADQVMKGATFTSEAGYLVEGTHECEDGVTLPDLGDKEGISSDLASGKQLLDDEGNIVEGTVPVVTGDARYSAWDIWDSNSSQVDEPYVSEYPNCVQIRGIIYDEMLIRQYSGMYAYVPKDIFGDASLGDVRKGKTFTSEFGVKAVGTMEEGSGGYAIKSGTTTSGTIDTGLSNVEQFFIYKETVTGTGLIHLHYTKSATSRLYASAWSTNSWGTKTITNGTGGVTVSGGTVTISATQAAQGALTSNVTYKWIAVGTE